MILMILRGGWEGIFRYTKIQINFAKLLPVLLIDLPKSFTVSLDFKEDDDQNLPLPPLRPSVFSLSPPVRRRNKKSIDWNLIMGNIIFISHTSLGALIITVYSILPQISHQQPYLTNIPWTMPVNSFNGLMVALRRIRNQLRWIMAWRSLWSRPASDILQWRKKTCEERNLSPERRQCGIYSV